MSPLLHYLPTPHADGSPIQPSELPSSLPAYLISVIPELRIDGQVVATGEPIGLGGTNIFTMTFSDPSYGASQVVNYIDAGVYQAIGLNAGRIGQDQLGALKAKMAATRTRLQSNDFSNITKDDLIGDLLFTTAVIYHAELGTMNYVSARTMGVNAITLPSETIFATKLKVLTLWGTPRIVHSGGLNMDADYLMQVVKASDGNAGTVRQYMFSSGMASSALEHRVQEQLFSTADNPVEGVSTVKVLKFANDQGIPIYTINHRNIGTALSQLQVDQRVKDDIVNAINAGKVVTVCRNNINFNGWVGCGYIITDPETYAAAYMISGGTNGGDSDGNETWGILDSFALAVSTQFSGMLKFIDKSASAPELKVFDGVSKKVGAVLSVIQWFDDLGKVNDRQIKDEWQWLSAYLAISSCLLLSVAISLAVPASAPVWFAMGVAIIGIIAINLIKSALLEYIFNAQVYHRNRFEV